MDSWVLASPMSNIPVLWIALLPSTDISGCRIGAAMGERKERLAPRCWLKQLLALTYIIPTMKEQCSSWP